MKKSTPIPNEIASKVMFASDQTCCVCRDKTKKTQIHHIDGDPSNHSFSNLSVLCFDCHSETMTNHAFARNLSQELVHLYNDTWRKIVSMRLKPEVDDDRREYVDEVLLEISLVCHGWKNFYMSLYPGNFQNTGYKGDNVWDLLSKIGKHKYSEEEWRRYLPLFDPELQKTIDRLEGKVMLHSEVIPTNIKLAILRTNRQLGTELFMYTQISIFLTYFKDMDDFFSLRFREVIRVLSNLNRIVDREKVESGGK